MDTCVDEQVVTLPEANEAIAQDKALMDALCQAMRATNNLAGLLLMVTRFSEQSPEWHAQYGLLCREYNESLEVFTKAGGRIDPIL